MGWPPVLTGVLVAVAAGLCGAWLLVRRFIGRRTREISEVLSSERVLKVAWRANLFGQASRKYTQLRGNGVLALTPGELCFFMLAPRREYRMSLGRITGFEHPESFKGRVAFRELLVVNLRDDRGTKDTLGILVDDPRGWAEEVTRAAGSLVTGGTE